MGRLSLNIVEALSGFAILLSFGSGIYDLIKVRKQKSVNPAAPGVTVTIKLPNGQEGSFTMPLAEAEVLVSQSKVVTSTP